MKPAWDQAALAGNASDMLQLLSEAGAQADGLLNSKDAHGQTALMLTALRGHEAVLDLLIERGAALDHTAKFGLSALMLAVINNHPGVVRKLVAAGASRSIRGTGAPGFYQKTALDLAIAVGRAELAEALSAEAASGRATNRNPRG